MVQPLSRVPLLQLHGLELARLLCGISQARTLEWVPFPFSRLLNILRGKPLPHSQE